MTDQLISFNTAKLLKEKGFGGKDCTTDYSYQYHPDINKYSLYKIPENNKSAFNGTKGIMKGGKEGYSAISQSLLQKWLREKYHLHIHIADLGFEMWSFMIVKLHIDGTQGKGGDLGKKNYKTYEEALEIGLQEALKLI